MEEQGTWAVRYSFGVHSFQEAEIVNMASRVREQFTDMLASLSVLLKIPERLHDAVLNNLSCLCECPGIVKSNHLAIILEQLLLVIVGIHVANTASHKEENDALRFRWVVNYPRARSGRLLVGECSHGESAKTTGDVPEGMSSGNVLGRMHAGKEKSF